MILAAVLTYCPEATGRLHQLHEAYLSLRREADFVWVVDNGSGEAEVEAITKALHARPWSHSDPIHTCGHGTNLQARILAGAANPGDLCVLSDDDMVWRPGWAQRLRNWWAVADSDVILTGCHIEPEYQWNTIAGRNEFPALYRESTGAASWTYRAESHDLIFPIPERSNGTGDVPACERVRRRGRIAQLDLAEHRGETSTWGNRTVTMFGDDTSSAFAKLRGEVTA